MVEYISLGRRNSNLVVAIKPNLGLQVGNFCWVLPNLRRRKFNLRKGEKAEIQDMIQSQERELLEQHGEML